MLGNRIWWIATLVLLAAPGAWAEGVTVSTQSDTCTRPAEASESVQGTDADVTVSDANTCENRVSVSRDDPIACREVSPGRPIATADEFGVASDCSAYAKV